MIIAIPKGKLMEDSINAFSIAGLDLNIEDNRKLLIKDRKNDMILSRAMDVPLYVENYADIGIAGTDTIMERKCDIMVPMKLNFGKCRMSICALKNYRIKDLKGKKIATKYPEITYRYFKKLGIDIEIVKLSGSIELAPLMGMSDAIVDIVQTGKTIRENKLMEIKKIMDVSAALIVNRLSYKVKYDEIRNIIEKMGVKEYEYQ